MIAALKDYTYMVRHSPNCPKRFEVRLSGLALLVSFSNGPKLRNGDAIGYGDTADEAAANALASLALSRPDRAPPPADETEAILEIIGHLGAALIQTVPSDDQIIMGHVKSAHDLACQLRRRLAK